MYYVLIVVHTLVCLAIIGIVLLQAGKGADIGSAFGGGGSQAVFGSDGHAHDPRQDHHGGCDPVHDHLVQPGKAVVARASGRPGERARACRGGPAPPAPPAVPK